MKPARDFTTAIVSDEKSEVLGRSFCRERGKRSVCSNDLDLGLLEEDIPDAFGPGFRERFGTLAVTAGMEMEDT